VESPEVAGENGRGNEEGVKGHGVEAEVEILKEFLSRV
jgi:hypothetical protein